MSYQAEFLTVHNGKPFLLDDCPTLPGEAFREIVLEMVEDAGHLAALFVTPAADQTLRLWAVVARDEWAELIIASTVVGDAYPALTPACPQAHWFEREIAEQWRVRPEGHPWLKPIRFQPARRTAVPDLWGRAADGVRCGHADFFGMAGEEVHEVAVGPVHAGVIEPGHFRFQCHGETVHHLEISLGYQHRGVERAMPTAPRNRRLHYMETLAGDTTIGHVMAHCRAVESLAAAAVPARAQAIRGIALELERIANHVGDLGALAGDVGFLPTMSYCGRIRGDVLNATALLCGNRFGRGLVRPGGVACDLEPARAETLLARLDDIARDAASAIELLWESPTVMARFEGAGTLDAELARSIGLVGVAARACGLARDVRVDFPYGIYRFTHLPVATCDAGDVFARAYVRWLEVQRSLAFLREQVGALPEGPLMEPLSGWPARSMVVALVEGWRGEICHVAITDDSGELAAYKVVDPSFHNWFGLACALRGQAISDFPMCNKSFNLSYCGHDL